MAKKKKSPLKGKRKNLLKTDPEQKPNLSYEQKVDLNATVVGKTVDIKKEEKKEEKLPEPKKAYVTRRPKTAFNTRKRWDQTN